MSKFNLRIFKILNVVFSFIAFIYIIYMQIYDDSKIKIMCIGDSITYGSKMPGSYRKFLYHNLTSKGFDIKMVGSKDQKIVKYYNNETNEYFYYQDSNCGFCGFTVSSFKERKGILEYMKKKNVLKLNPDIIILQIGTNNVMENYSMETTIIDFISLLQHIFKNIGSNTILFVATIPDLNPNNKRVYNWFKNYRKSDDGKIINDDKVKKMVSNNVIKFNKEIKKVVDDFRKKKYKIRLENLNAVIKDIDNLLFDGVHPNDKGYKIMGDFWTEIIEKYLNEKNNKTQNISKIMFKNLFKYK